MSEAFIFLVYFLMVGAVYSIVKDTILNGFYDDVERFLVSVFWPIAVPAVLCILLGMHLVAKFKLEGKR